MRQFVLLLSIVGYSLAIVTSGNAADSRPPVILSEAQASILAAVHAEFDPQIEKLEKRLRDLVAHKPKPSSPDSFGPNAKREPETKAEQEAWKSFSDARDKLYDEIKKLKEERSQTIWLIYTAEQRKTYSLKVLESKSPLEFVETPVKDVLGYFHDAHNCILVIDESAAEVVKDSASVISLVGRGITFDSELQLVLDQVGLVHILRDGSITIASKEAARNYLTQGADDPAPLMAAKKSERKKRIQAALAQSVTYSCANKQLEKVLDDLEGPKGDFFVFAMYTSSVADYKITVELKNVPLKDALTKMLTRARLKYEVRDEAIVIMPSK